MRPPPTERILAAYRGGTPVAVICEALRISERTLYAALDAAGEPRRNAPRPIAADRYARTPTTPRQRRALAALDATPDAPLAEIAARAGVSPAYLSRLRRHWLALRETR